MQAGKYKNTLLTRLEPESINRLALSLVKFDVGHEIEFPGSPIANVIFVEEGMASMTTTLKTVPKLRSGCSGTNPSSGFRP